MNALDFYNRFFGTWAGYVIQLSFVISAFIIVYISLIIYRYRKRRKPYWNVELSVIPFTIMIVLITLIGIQIERRYEQQLVLPQQKESVHKGDTRAAEYPELMAAARKMGELAGFEEILSESIPETVSLAADSVRNNRPDLKEQDYQHYKEILREQMQKGIPGILQKIASLYAEHYTLAEFRELNGFYDSAVGKKSKLVEANLSPRILQITPKWSQEATKAARVYIEKFTPLITRKKNVFSGNHSTAETSSNNAGVPQKTIGNPEYLMAAQKHLKVIGFDEVLTVTIDATVKLGTDNARKTHPNLKEEVYQHYGDILRKEMQKGIPGIMQKVALLYAGQYTLAEFQEISRFSMSPIGKKSKQVDNDLSPVFIKIIQSWPLKAAQTAAESIN